MNREWEMLQWSRDLEVAEREDSQEDSQEQARLQWSRDLEVAESWYLEIAMPVGPALQWSRDLEVAERPTTLAIPTGRYCFNGAATWKSRKVKRTSLAVGVVLSFNGAATWKSRKAEV